MKLWKAASWKTEVKMGDNIKDDVGNMESEHANWVHLDQNMTQRESFVAVILQSESQTLHDRQTAHC
jgi:hypothetical protein